MSRLDIRKHPDYNKAIGRLQHVKLRPLVGPRELDELAIVTDALPELRFPINSAGELVDQIGADKTLPVLGMAVDPVRMIKFMPAYYFPIASYENLIEKMAELLRANRRQVDEDKYVAKMKVKMRRVRFPITSPAELERALGDTPEFNVNGRKMNTKKTIGALPRDFFPVRDQQDLAVKAMRYLRSRPLIEKD
jgi:hypothetical protein